MKQQLLKITRIESSIEKFVSLKNAKISIFVIDMNCLEALELVDAIDSPCIRNCCLDDQDICLGCYRSLEEIKAWSRATDEARGKILLLAEKRKKYREEQLSNYYKKNHE